MTHDAAAQSDDHSRTAPIIASVDRMPATVVEDLHPSLLTIEMLTSESSQRFQRRSGPGGQHRNKTSSGVFLEHQPTGVTAEATERRSQHDNRAVAIKRLRFQLAVHVRSAAIFDRVGSKPESELRQSCCGGNLKFNDNNFQKPAVIALLLNDLHAVGGQPRWVAKRWSVSTSAIVNLLKSHPAAFGWLNQCRHHHDRRPLK